MKVKPKRQGNFPGAGKGMKEAQSKAEGAGRSAIKSMQSNPTTYRVGTDREGAIQCPAGNVEDPKFSNKRSIPGS